MEKCKICGKEFKQVTATHIKTHDMTVEEYEAYDTKVEEVEEDKSVISPKEKTEKIFGKEETSDGKLLTDFLKEFDITEKELRGIVRTYKTGNPIDVVQDIKRKQKFGEETAEQLKNNPTVETHSLPVADALVHKFGFTVTKVTSTPKTWHLKK